MVNISKKQIIAFLLALSLYPLLSHSQDSTSTNGANDGISKEIFKSDGIVQLKCKTGGLAPVTGVRVSCNNPGGANLCNGTEGSSGGGKNKKTKASRRNGKVSGIQVAKVMYDCLNKIVPICSKKIGCSGNKIKINTMGGHADRPKNTMKGGSRSPSKHCGGFAIDFSSIECEGKKLELTRPGRRKAKKDYDSFRTCWDEEVEKQCTGVKQAINERFEQPAVDFNKKYLSFILNLIEPAYAKKSKRHSIACQGAPRPKNAKHNDHMHGSVDSPTGKPGGI